MSIPLEFEEFPKVPRLVREAVVTEKLDGTNAQVVVSTEQPDTHWFVPVSSEGVTYYLLAGSRSRFIDTSKSGDNYGFAKWVEANCEELVKLGPGRHFGEWWGQGIQRNYGLTEKRFSLFNVDRWSKVAPTVAGSLVTQVPSCCDVVPVLGRGPFCTVEVLVHMANLKEKGSYAAPGFMNPEGVMVYHTAIRKLFKRTFEKDMEGKGQ